MSTTRGVLVGSLVAACLMHVARIDARAQERGDVTAIGMSRSTVALARGISSLSTNVGAIALDALGPRDSLRRAELDLAALPMGIAAGATYLNPDEFAFIFSDKDCGVFSDADRRRLYDLLAPDRMSVDAALDLVAVRFRLPGMLAVGLQYGHRVRVRMNFPEAFRADVLGTGDVYAGGRTYEGADVGGEWIKRIGISFGGAYERDPEWPPRAAWFPVVGAGATVAVLEGVAHFDVDPSSYVVTSALPPGPRGLRRLGVDGYYAFRSSVPEDFEPSQAIVRPGFSGNDSTRATGWGGGFGISAVVYRTVRLERRLLQGTPLNPEMQSVTHIIARDAVTFGIAVDELGALDWDGPNLRRARTIDTVVTEQRGGLTYEVLCGYRGVLDTVGGFTTTLPAQLRLGAGVDVTAFVPSIRGDLHASAEGAFDLNDAIGSEGAARFSLGAMWSPWPAFGFSTGVQLGGRRDVAWGLGFAVRPFRWLSLQAATSDWTGLLAGTDEYDLAARADVSIRL